MTLAVNAMSEATPDAMLKGSILLSVVALSSLMTTVATRLVDMRLKERG